MATVANIAIGLCEQVGSSGPIAPGGFFGRPMLNGASYELALGGRFLVDKIDKTADREASTPGALAVTSAIAGFRAQVGAVVLVDDQYWTALTVATPYDMEGSYQSTSIDLVRAAFDAVSPARDATAQSLRLVGDGNGVTCLDGMHYAELCPSPVNQVNLLADDPDAGAGTFNSTDIKAIWGWVDSRGNKHRGACPGPAAESVAIDSVTVDARWLGVPWPGISAFNGERGQLTLDLYGLGEDELFHFTATVRPIEHADWPNHAIFSAVAGVTDLEPHQFNMPLEDTAALLAAPVLYTDDDELAAMPPPPALDIVSTQQRLWILSAQDRLSVLPSKPIAVNFAPEFAPELEIRIPHEGGECTALASLGDRIAVFKERQVYTIFGEPGAADGSGSTVQVPRLLVADAGCVSRLSVVEILPRGVAFQSQQGLSLLTPDGRVEFIGAAVRDSLGSNSVTSATLVRSEEEVRWTLDNDTALVWSYTRNAWAVWTGFDAVDSCDVGGVFARLDDDRDVLLETPETWTAAGSGKSRTMHELTVSTPWLKLGATQGLQRVSKAIVILRWYTGAVSITAGYDYASTLDTVARWEPAALTALKNGNGIVQLSIDVMDPRCEAIRFVISEDTETLGESPTLISGRGFELIGIDIVAGMKRGTYRHKQADEAKG